MLANYNFIKNKLIFLLSFSVVVFCLFGVCLSGCIAGEKPEQRAERCKEYLQIKYDEEFTYWDYDFGGKGTTVYKFYPTAKGYTNSDELARVVYDKNEENFGDTYLRIKYMEQTKALTKKCMSELFGTDYYFNVPYDTSDFSYDPKCPEFEEYIASDQNKMILTMATKKTAKVNSDNIIDTINTCFKNNRLRFDLVKGYLIGLDIDLKNITSDNIIDILNPGYGTKEIKNFYISFNYYLTKDYQATDVSIRYSDLYGK